MAIFFILLICNIKTCNTNSLDTLLTGLLIEIYNTTDKPDKKGPNPINIKTRYWIKLTQLSCFCIIYLLILFTLLSLRQMDSFLESDDEPIISQNTSIPSMEEILNCTRNKNELPDNNNRKRKRLSFQSAIEKSTNFSLIPINFLFVTCYYYL